jgi:hypothetical protein
MSKVRAVVATYVTNNGVVDFTFLHYAGPETYRLPWGTLELINRCGGAYRWNLGLYASGQGLMVGAGIEFTEDGSTLVELLRDALQGADEFTLLVAAEVLPHLQAACETLSTELISYPVDLPLATSANPYPSGR